MFVYVWRDKKRDEKQGAVLPKRIKNNISIYIYIHIEREREREEQEEGETRGERSASPRNSGRESKEE